MRNGERGAGATGRRLLFYSTLLLDPLVALSIVGARRVLARSAAPTAHPPALNSVLALPFFVVLLRGPTLHYLIGSGSTPSIIYSSGVPASYLALAGRVYIAPVVGSTHGHALFPKKAGFEIRYIEFGIVKPPGVLCQR
jgi:hypothetical protein